MSGIPYRAGKWFARSRVTRRVPLLWAFAVRAPADVFGAVGGDGSGRILAPLLASALAASYVFSGFDTAGSLAEDTKTPRRNAPRAILQKMQLIS